MLKNYIKLAFKNLKKYKLISFVNIFGLTIGFTSCLLILAYILNEVSYDKFNKKADQVYRLTRTFYNGNGEATLKLATVAPPFGYYFPTAFPEIEKLTRLFYTGTVSFKHGDKLFTEQNAYFGDEDIFDVFTIKVMNGNPKTALEQPFTMMINEETARKYFGNENPINKVVKINNRFDVKVTGVYKSFPANSHIHPEILLSFNTLKDPAVYGDEQLRTNWGNNSFYTYLLLPEHYDVKKMKSRFPAFLDEYMRDQYGANKPSVYTSLDLQRLTDIHLHSHTDLEAEPNGDIRRIYIFGAIAIFILLIACINYMNLATARSTLRSKEIGVRKVVGASRKALISQFLGESILLTLIAMTLAFLLLFFTLPWLNQVSGQTLSIRTILKWQVMIPLLMAPFVVGFLAGAYPALFMSAMQPVKTLKGLARKGEGNVNLRKALVVTQFSISIVLIIITAVVYQQMHYLQNAKLGYDKEHIITLPFYIQQNDNFSSFRNTLLRNPAIADASRSSRIPTGRLLDNMGASVAAGDSMMPVKADIKYVMVDYDFIPTYGINIVSGRNFSRDFGTDTTSFIINEIALKSLGFRSPETAIGQKMKYGKSVGQIIGVMKNFNFESLHEDIKPLILIMPTSQQGLNQYSNISIKISGKDIPGALTTIKNAWHQFLPDFPYQYNFLDENFARLYSAEQKQETIFLSFSCIAIIIACLGLFGLSAFSISQRVKEIGIRKVLGAGSYSLVQMLCKEFLVLVSVASLIAFPVAWYSMNKWLQRFAYHVEIHWYIFFIAALLALLLALLTVGLQALKAAQANPVKNLRTE